MVSTLFLWYAVWMYWTYFLQVLYASRVLIEKVKLTVREWDQEKRSSLTRISIDNELELFLLCSLLVFGFSNYISYIRDFISFYLSVYENGLLCSTKGDQMWWTQWKLTLTFPYNITILCSYPSDFREDFSEKKDFFVGELRREEEGVFVWGKTHNE